MQWRNDREKQVGSSLGFVLKSSARGGNLVNLVFDKEDVDHNNPRQGNVRPASMAEVKMWRMLINADSSV